MRESCLCRHRIVQLAVAVSKVGLNENLKTTILKNPVYVHTFRQPFRILFVITQYDNMSNLYFF